MIKRTASEIAELCGATLEGDGSIELVGCASLRDARSDQVSFLGNPLYRSELEETRAGAVLLAPEVDVRRADLALLRCKNPSSAFTHVIELFLGDGSQIEPGVHPRAFVDPSAELGAGVAVGPNATIGARARVGEGCVIHANAVVGAECVLGAGSVLFPAVVLYPRVQIGARCTLHSGAVIGSDGFGFEPGPNGWVKIPQCGWVEIGDDVEIGANTTIDRGRFDATRIESGVKIDNLCHIGHNSILGEGTLLVAQVGLSGSTRVGRGVIFGGKSATSGHNTIGDRARIAARAGVTKNVPAGETWSGFPAGPRVQTLRLEAAQRRVPELLQAVKELEQRVRDLEQGRAERGGGER